MILPGKAILIVLFLQGFVYAMSIGDQSGTKARDLFHKYQQAMIADRAKRTKKTSRRTTIFQKGTKSSNQNRKLKKSKKPKAKSRRNIITYNYGTNTIISSSPMTSSEKKEETSSNADEPSFESQNRSYRSKYSNQRLNSSRRLHSGPDEDHGHLASRPYYSAAFEGSFDGYAGSNPYYSQNADFYSGTRADYYSNYYPGRNEYYFSKQSKSKSKKSKSKKHKSFERSPYYYTRERKRRFKKVKKGLPGPYYATTGDADDSPSSGSNDESYYLPKTGTNSTSPSPTTPIPLSKTGESDPRYTLPVPNKSFDVGTIDGSNR